MLQRLLIKDDEVAIDIYKMCAEYLGRGLSLLIDILNPEVIILGSIYGRAKSLIEPYMREMLEKEAINYSYKYCKIVPACISRKYWRHCRSCFSNREQSLHKKSNQVTHIKKF
ncbi:MAG: ROK family protein [Segetibacter sp.]